MRPHDLSPDLPVALARRHRELAVGQVLDLEIPEHDRLDDLLVGAGFDPATRCRLRTLPDFVGPAMRVLVCGLNPSLVAADAGYGYAGRTNRFWPAALAAGLVIVARDPFSALLSDRVGMTDLVKRATPGATELTAGEYREGAARVGRLVDWLRPELVLFVGLAGWRAAVDWAARPGWQAGRAAAEVLSVPAYVMPSTSGLNARLLLADLVEHMKAALDPPPVA